MFGAQHVVLCRDCRDAVYGDSPDDIFFFEGDAELVHLGEHRHQLRLSPDVRRVGTPEEIATGIARLAEAGVEVVVWHEERP